jgi:hypothetical protein
VVAITAPADGANVAPGATVVFSATATDAESGNLASQIQWTSSRDGALGTGASISRANLSAGTHTITARVTDGGGAVGQATISLNAGSPPTVTILTPAPGLVAFQNDPIGFSATADDAQDGNLSAQIQWSSSLDGALGTGSSILVSTLRIGTHVISAAVTDASGITTTSQVTVRVRGPNVAPVVTVSAPANGGSLPAGSTVNLVATASDDFDGDVTSQIQWSSSRDGAIPGSGGARTVVLSEGAHTLTARVVDSDGAEGSSAVSFTVTATAPVVSITSPAAATTTTFAGTSVAFAGTASDASDGSLTAGLVWTSSLDGQIGTGGGFTTSALTVGTHVVTAAVTDAGGLTGEAQRTVVVRPANATPTITIQSPADADALVSGRPVLLAATATDVEDGNLGAAVRWTSSRDGALGTGASVTVPSLSVGAHTITAAVTDLDGLSASASVTVSVAASTLTFTPTLDTYVDAGSANASFGTATNISADGSPIVQGLLRFAVSGTAGYAVQQAILRLTVDSVSGSPSDRGGTISRVSNDTWTETTTYNTRPTIDGPQLADNASAVSAGQVVDFVVTPAVTGDGSVNLALTQSSTNGVIYKSREAATGKPQLIVTLGQNTRPVVAITAPASGTNAVFGAAVTFTGTATDAESGNLASQIQWTSSRDGALGTGASITRSNLSPGSHTITARVTDPGGLVGEREITVNVGHPPTVTITSPANNAIIVTTTLPSLTLAATATDVEDGEVASQIQWTSSLDGPLGTGAAIGASGLRVGTHVLTAAVTDSTGVTGQAQVTIRVRTPNVAPTVTITAPANGASTPAGTSVTLIASASDDFDGPLSPQIHWTSSRDGDLGIGASRTVTLREGAHTLTASVTDSDGAAGSAQIAFTVTPTAPAVTITAPAVGTRVFAGASVGFAGSATDATDGVLTSGLTWTSDRDGVIGHGGSFAVTSLTIGTHVVTAAVTDAGGLGGSAQRTVVVRPANTPPTIAIDAPTEGGTFFSGKPVLLAATAADAEDGDLFARVQWSSNRDGAFAPGAVITVPSLSVGTHALTATVTDLDGAAQSATVNVTVGSAVLTFNAVADTYVDANATSTKFGTATTLVADASPIKETYLRFTVSGVGLAGIESAKLRLTAGSASASSSDAGGIVNAISNNTWSEANTSYSNRPSVDGPALASAGAVAANQVVDFTVTPAVFGDGTFNFALVTTSSNDVIYNSREAASGRPQLIVTLAQNQAPIVHISAPASGVSINPGTALTFTATATDAESGNLSSQIQWSSSQDGNLGTGASISVSTLTSGTHVVTARVTDGGGRSGEASVTVNVGRPPVVNITAPANNSVFFVDQLPVQLTATATDFEDGDLRDTLVWTSDRDGAIGVGPLVVASLSIGTHVITAAVTDSAGLAGQKQITVRVRGPNQPPVVTITGPANGVSIPAGTPLALVATAQDDFDGDVAGLVRWTSSQSGLLGTGVPLTVTPSEGTHVVTASVVDSDGALGTAQVTFTVTATPPVVTITAPAAGTRVFAGTSLTFAATALDATDGNRAATLRWVSDRDGQIGVGASFATSTLSIGTHVVTATATDTGGLVGQAQRTVVVRPANVPPTLAIETPSEGGTFSPGGRRCSARAPSTSRTEISRRRYSGRRAATARSGPAARSSPRACRWACTPSPPRSPTSTARPSPPP